MTITGEIVRFWLDEVGQAGWYAAVDAVDDAIRDRFGPLWQEACEGRHVDWCETPQGALAYLILTDQFSRNMFRGDARLRDRRGRRAAARIALGRARPCGRGTRGVFFMPFEHSEALEDQDFAVDLMGRNLPKTGAGYLLHARAHREVIRRFGRFPFRNDALGRETTPEEAEFLAGGGYAAIVRELGG